MRFLKSKTGSTISLIDEQKPKIRPKSLSNENHYSSIQLYTLKQDPKLYSNDQSLPPAEYVYTEIIKAIGNNEFIEEKRLVKRASWDPTVIQEHSLPPTGKRFDNDQIAVNRNLNRVRMRPKVSRYYQSKDNLQANHSTSFRRPVSFNERYSRQFIEYQHKKLSNSSLDCNSSFLCQRHEPSPSPSSLSSIDSILQNTKRSSPSIENSDFISETSTLASVTTANTITSVSSIIPSYVSRKPSPHVERIRLQTKSPISNEYQQNDSTGIDYKFSSPFLQINAAVPSPSSRISTEHTCSKGHEQSPSFPIGSSLNQQKEFTSQTVHNDTHQDDDICHPKSTTSTTTHHLTTMSVAPNNYHNQRCSTKAIVTSTQISPIANVTITTNNYNGLKQQEQRDQIESSMRLSANTNVNNNNNNNNNNNTRIKKTVHFDWNLPREIRSTSSSSPVKANYNSNYRPMVTIASSFTLSNGNSNSDNDQQRKLYDDQFDVETLKEKKRNETTQRTIVTSPLTIANTIARSFSLSPSPLSNEESNDSRRCKEEKKKENVDEPNCTTSRRVTTAATHLHCTTTTATVNFNDGSNNVSQKKESNTTDNFNKSTLKRQASSTNKSMPLNTLLVKTTSLSTIANPQVSQQPSSTSTAKKLITNGFFNFIGRSNSSNNKSLTSTEENKQLRRTSSTQLRAQRKAKQQTTLTTGTNGSKRLSADVESLLPVSPINNNHCEISKEDIHIFGKVTTNQNAERQSLISLVGISGDKNNINGTSSSNINSSSPRCASTNIHHSNSMSMSTNSTTKIVQSDEGDSLNNGLLFRPVNDPKCDYVLHNLHTTKKEPFFLSPTKLSSNEDESTMMQTSTLIISTPAQYHYYLYPPINNTNTLSSSLSSSSSSASSSLSSKANPKIISTTNRTISNVSINSVSTNSSSSYPSNESQIHDNEYLQSSQVPLNAEDETISSSTYSVLNNNNNNNKTRQKKVVQSALIDWKMRSSSEINNDITPTKTKPVTLSDSVQAFWPPPPSPSILEKPTDLSENSVNHERSNQQSESVSISNNIMNSTNNHDSINVNQTDLLSTNEEIGSYSEQHVFNSGCLRNASDTSLEDTQASYTERLREKSRSISMNGNNDISSYLTRSLSKDTLHEIHTRSSINDFSNVNENILKMKSNLQQNIPNKSSTFEHDFQSKREFFENHRSLENQKSNSLISIQTNILPSKPKLYILSPSPSPSPINNNNNHSQQTTINNNPPRNVTRRSWNDMSSRSVLPLPPTTSDCNISSTSNETSPPLPPTSRKPSRILKVVKQSSPSKDETTAPTTRPLRTTKTYSLAKPGLFTASPINSYQKLSNKPLNSYRRYQSRDENDLQFSLKEFALRYRSNSLLNELAHLTISNEYHLSTDYTRTLFPIPDRLRRIRSRQSSGGDTNSITTASNNSLPEYIPRTVSTDDCCSMFDDDALRQAEDLLTNLRKRFESLKENQRIINEEMEENKNLGAKLINILESSAESNEIEKLKLHINEIDTITSILLKLSSRLAKVENDLLMLSDNNEHTKASLIERREKAQQKHEEAKSLKDGIDRRSRLVTNILRKYFSNELYDDYEHFIRMKSTLLMDGKDIEENIVIVEKQIDILNKLFVQNVKPTNNREITLNTQTSTP